MSNSFAFGASPVAATIANDAASVIQKEREGAYLGATVQVATDGADQEFARLLFGLGGIACQHALIESLRVGQRRRGTPLPPAAGEPRCARHIREMAVSLAAINKVAFPPGIEGH